MNVNCVFRLEKPDWPIQFIGWFWFAAVDGTVHGPMFMLLVRFEANALTYHLFGAVSERGSGSFTQ